MAIPSRKCRRRSVYPSARAVHHLRRRRGLREVDAAAPRWPRASAARRRSVRRRASREARRIAEKIRGILLETAHARARSRRGVAALRGRPAAARRRGDPAALPRQATFSCATASRTRPRPTRSPAAASTPRWIAEVDARVREGVDAGPDAALRLRPARGARARQGATRSRAPARRLRVASRRRSSRSTSACARRSWRSRGASPSASPSCASTETPPPCSRRPGRKSPRGSASHDGAREARRGSRPIPGSAPPHGRLRARLDEGVAPPRRVPALSGRRPRRNVRELPESARRVPSGPPLGRAGGRPDPRRSRSRGDRVRRRTPLRERPARRADPARRPARRRGRERAAQVARGARRAVPLDPDDDAAGVAPADDPFEDRGGRSVPAAAPSARTPGSSAASRRTTPGTWFSSCRKRAPRPRPTRGGARRGASEPSGRRGGSRRRPGGPSARRRCSCWPKPPPHPNAGMRGSSPKSWPTPPWPPKPRTPAPSVTARWPGSWRRSPAARARPPSGTPRSPRPILRRTRGGGTAGCTSRRCCSGCGRRRSSVKVERPSQLRNLAGARPSTLDPRFLKNKNSKERRGASGPAGSEGSGRVRTWELSD